MSSDLQSALELLQLNNYASVVIITAVTYDYFLNFSKEVDYVWCKSWTWVSTIFVLLRYVGLSWAIITGLGTSTFLPGTIKHRSFKGTALYLILDWEFAIFLAAADSIMILRLYAMWNQSKRILYILLFIFVPQVILSFIFIGIYNNPNKYITASAFQILDFSLCTVAYSNPLTLERVHLYSGIVRVALSATLLIFAVIQTVKQSAQMAKANKQWQPNQYMQQFIKDGTLYFFVYVFYILILILANYLINSDTTSILFEFLVMLAIVAMTPMMPRFIISMRELYDRDIRGRWEGIDTAFGALSQPAGTENTVISMMAFADGNTGQVVEGDEADSEAIRLEVRDGGYQV